MSFILDALKKSESDRQRQSGPALFEVKVAPPRTRLPLWAVAIAALLVVNLGIVMWMVLRHAAHGTEAPAPATSAASGAAPASAPALTAAAPVAPGAPAATAGSSTAAAAATRLAAATSPPPPAATHTTALHEPPPVAPVTEELNPDDYAPAQDSPLAQNSASTRRGDHVRRGTAAGVPLYQDAASTPGTQIPQLRMDLHVFAARPQDRFVMINMHKLREGDSLPEGVRVDSITPDGAVLSYNGSRFLLPRE